MTDADAAVGVRDDRSDWVLLAFRVALGFLFLAQGTTKWGWFGGTEPPGMGGLEQFLEILGYDSTTTLAWLLTATEVAAGLMLIAGLLTPLAAAGIIGIAFNGVFVLSWGVGFVNGYGLWIVYMAAAAALAVLGPGRFSVDHVAPWRSVGWVERWLVGARAGVVAIAFGLLAGLVVVTGVGPGFDSTPGVPDESAAPPGGGEAAEWCRLHRQIGDTLDAGGSVPNEVFDELVAAAPGDIRPASETAAEAFTQSPGEAFSDPQVQAAVAAMDEYRAANCL